MASAGPDIETEPCTFCGSENTVASKVETRDDNLHRYTCHDCGETHYNIPGYKPKYPDGLYITLPPSW